MGVVYFVDELVDVYRIECFGHVEGGEDCSMGEFFLLKPVSMVLLIYCRAVVVECATLKPCWEDYISGDVWEDDFF